MITERGPKVLEYNCRFGDPETQVVLPLLDCDLAQLFSDIADGYLNIDEVKWKDLYAVCVVLAAKGYPDTYEKGIAIEGLDNPKLKDVLVFHAGTSKSGGKIVTSGGRVLGLTATDHTVKGAICKAYEAVNLINFDGMQYRQDIGHKSGRVHSSYF
jgi:phosphoribosylamine--glycine ligase